MAYTVSNHQMSAVAVKWPPTFVPNEAKSFAYFSNENMPVLQPLLKESIRK
ncbi:MAG: hypothetical protein HOA06_08800 [Chloroflexi bacterium]|nr:hypothetical protein [Chloroflexota bacterium]MBT7004799.1 hypothetical protein [Chloroflexota bacterium]